MTDEEERLMGEYNITCEKKMVFQFDGRRYDRLSDAVNYAKKQALDRTEEASTDR